jgi:two-component system response regulator
MLHILILEDSRILQKIYQIYLPSDKYHLNFSSNGLEGLSYLSNPENKKPDLIILDLEMPVIGGSEFLQKIKGSINLNRFPIVICSSLPPSSNPDPSKKYLMKPFGPNDLISLINSVFV